jgi:hypothetical protein
MEDLKVLLPDEDLILNGEEIAVRPFPFGKIPKVVTQASMLIQMVLSLPPDLITDEGNIDIENPATAIILASMLEQGGEQIFSILALAVGKPKEWVESLPPDEGLLLLIKVWEVNKDFFMKRLGPLLRKLKPVTEKQPEQMNPSNGEQSSVN